jgi:hypothetical protein
MILYYKINAVKIHHFISKTKKSKYSIDLQDKKNAKSSEKDVK